ncbi:MAG: AmmeMemoRadiSam system radical SAM enzyme, partial [Candidatus Latescibacterota bacterium]
MEASFFRVVEGETVRCELCPHFCRIPGGGSGACRVRTNRGGVLYAEGYGKAVSFAVDPVEKKPLYHFYPSRRILSTG